MKSKIFLFVGFLLLAVGIFVYYMIGLDTTQIVVNNRPVSGNEIRNIVATSVGGGLAALGGVFLIIGIVGIKRDSKQKKENLHIMRTGISAEGRVNFVDKNYSLLVNNKPIYSIVEYSYNDKLGNHHTRRITNLNSDIVIRNQIKVGGTVSIKYDEDDYSKSVIIL